MKTARILWLCNGGMICVAIGGSLFPVFLTTFSEAFNGLDKEQLGRIAGILFAGFIVGILVSGPLADRMGAKIFAVGGMALTVIGLIILASAQYYSILLTASLVIGLGAGVLDMVMSPIVSICCTDRRTAALNNLHAYYCVGAIGTIFFATTGLWLGIPWRAMTLVMAVVPAVLMIGFMFITLPPMVHPDHERQGFRKLIKMPRFYVALLMIGLIGATEEGMAQWLPAYSERALGFSKTTGGMALLLFQINMMIGRMISSRIAGKVNGHALVGFGGLLCGVLYLIGAWAPTPYVGLFSCALVGLGCSVLWPTTLAITADRIPQGGATMFALMAAMGNLGCLIAPWAEGIIADRANLHTAFFANGWSPLLLVAVVLLIWRKDRRTRTLPASEKSDD